MWPLIIEGSDNQGSDNRGTTVVINMHDPVLAGWCMVVTTKSMAETTQKPFQKRDCFMVVTRLLLA